MKSYEAQIKAWLRCDEDRMHALQLAASLGLPDWCIAAGFVRNLVWDKLHGDDYCTPLADLDLIYFDQRNCSEKLDEEYELNLKAKSEHPWSVKNQARMHVRNNDEPYNSTDDAMSYWVEVETAVGVRLSPDNGLEILAPFGCESLFQYTITMNAKRKKPDAFEFRLDSKRWLSRWPKLTKNT